MKYTHVYVLVLMVIFHSSCGQNQTNAAKDTVKPESKNTVPSYRSNDPKIHTTYEYSDATGKRLVIQNGFPRGMKYTDPNGEVYSYAIFWTHLINETDKPLELKINFPVDSYEDPFLPGKYFEILVPADTMTLDKIPLFDYGMTDLKSFLDKSIHKPSSLKRIINPKKSSGFYIVILRLRVEGAQGSMLRTGLILKGQDLFYRISRYTSTSPISLIDEKEINSGSINLNLK
jgi:hypothetical protein